MIEERAPVKPQTYPQHESGYGSDWADDPRGPWANAWQPVWDGHTASAGGDTTKDATEHFTADPGDVSPASDAPLQ
jgi:hypothetical protein